MSALETDMTVLAHLQAEFRASIMEPNDASITPAITAAIKVDNIPANTGLIVYRNNVFSSLRRALTELYPVVSRLVGEVFFAAMADEYIKGTPPTHARLNEYGQTFPAFLRGFPPAAALPFLGDVAMLELAWNDAFHTADAQPLRASALTSVSKDVLPTIRLELHPTARLLRSDYPIHAIWQANQPDEHVEEVIDLAEGADHLLVHRPDRQVLIYPLSTAAWVFLTALAKSTPLVDAFDQAIEVTPDLDFQSLLVDLLHLGVFTNFSTKHWEIDHA